MSKNKDSKLPSKGKQVEYFDIKYEASIYYPKGESVPSKGTSMYRRPKSSGSFRGRHSVFQLANC